MNNGSSVAKAADVVILGAGVMGTAIAFHLAKRKAGKIVVVDKGHVGQGGSGRPATFVILSGDFPFAREWKVGVEGPLIE